jgi:hypothetical protein
VLNPEKRAQKIKVGKNKRIKITNPNRIKNQPIKIYFKKVTY